MMAEEPFPFEAEDESSKLLLERCTTATATGTTTNYTYDVGLGSVGIGMVVTAGIYKYLVETVLRSNFDNTSKSFLYTLGVSWLPFLVFSLGVGVLAICLAQVKLHYSPTSDTDAVIGAVAVLCLGVAGPLIGFSDEPAPANMDRSSRFYSLISSWFPLLVHSVGVGLLAYCLAQWRAKRSNSSISAASDSENDTRRNPNTITRLRSHLTFLPIIQLIRQRATTQGICETTEESSTSCSGIAFIAGKCVDKEFMSKLEVQRDSFADAIVHNCILPWYEQISEDKVFPARAKFVIVHFCEQLSKKIRKIDRTQLSKEAIEVVHFHWANYCEATKEAPNKDFRYVHDFIGDREAMVKHLEALTSLLIKDSIVPELQSSIVCQFLASVLTKAVILYYVDLVTNPEWINMTVKNLVSSRILTEVNSLSHGSSQESLSDLSSVKHEDDSISSKIQMDVTETCTLGAETESSELLETTVTSDTANGDDRAEPEASDSSPEDVKPEPLNLFAGIPLAVPLVGDGKQDVTVSAALGGLLSTTALTLLPDGYAYATMTKSGSVSPIAPGLPGDKISMDKLDEASKLLQDSSSDNKDDEAAGKNIGGVTRHYSLEGVKSRNAALDAEKVYQSLDDSKSDSSAAAGNERGKNLDLTLLTAGSSEDPEKLHQISPMYDEAEDFAATIAKLRSLLEQRESQKNLLKNDTAIPNTEADADVFAQSQKEVTESDPRQITKQSSTPNSRSSVSTNRPSLNSQGSASSLGSEMSSSSLISHNSWDGDKLEKIEDVLEEGGPVINRFFLNVAIPKTENCSDSSGQFVLYSIQYEGVYPEENDDGVLEKLVMRTTTIKRRFQEFLLLQSQMEESTIWKPHLKGIKAPTKWFSLSFAKSDTSNINQRKVILERYLQQLCYHPVLGFCPLLRQFMAYGEEGFQAFTSSDEIPIHRFNKFTKKFTGVFNSLREVLPSFETDLLAAPATNNPDAPPRSPAEIKARSLLALFLREERIAEHDETSGPADDPLATKDEDVENAIAAEPDATGEGASAEAKAEETAVDVGQIKEVYPLAVAMTNLLCDVLWLPPHRPHSASISTFLSISGRSFESYLEESLDVLVCQEAWVGYLETLSTSVKAWGQAEDGKELPSPESEQVTEAELKQVLQAKIPVWIRWMWGRSRVDMTIDRLTKVCQDAKINQDLVLSLVELVFSKLIDSVEREVAKSE